MIPGAERWQHLQARAGSTLIELMVAVAVLSVASVAFFAFFVSHNRLSETEDRMYRQQQSALFALRTMEERLLNAGYNRTGTDFVLAQAGSLDVYVSSSGRVTFRLEQTQKKVLQDGHVIYPEMNVVGLIFRYYDSSGGALPAPVTGGNLGAIREVEIELQVAPPARSIDLGQRSTLTFNSRVAPRNLGLN